MSNRQGMRYAMLPAVLLIGAFACSPRAGTQQAASPSLRGRMAIGATRLPPKATEGLFLIVAGQDSEQIQPYLYELCAFIAKEPSLRERYHTIFLSHREPQIYLSPKTAEQRRFLEGSEDGKVEGTEYKETGPDTVSPEHAPKEVLDALQDELDRLQDEVEKIQAKGNPGEKSREIQVLYERMNRVRTDADRMKEKLASMRYICYTNPETSQRIETTELTWVILTKLNFHEESGISYTSYTTRNQPARHGFLKIDESSVKATVRWLAASTLGDPADMLRVTHSSDIRAEDLCERPIEPDTAGDRQSGPEELCMYLTEHSSQFRLTLMPVAPTAFVQDPDELLIEAHGEWSQFNGARIMRLPRIRLLPRIMLPSRIVLPPMWGPTNAIESTPTPGVEYQGGGYGFTVTVRAPGVYSLPISVMPQQYAHHMHLVNTTSFHLVVHTRPLLTGSRKVLSGHSNGRITIPERLRYFGGVTEQDYSEFEAFVDSLRVLPASHMEELHRTVREALLQIPTPGTNEARKATWPALVEGSIGQQQIVSLLSEKPPKRNEFEKEWPITWKSKHKPRSNPSAAEYWCLKLTKELESSMPAWLRFENFGEELYSWYSNCAKRMEPHAGSFWQASHRYSAANNSFEYEEDGEWLPLNRISDIEQRDEIQIRGVRSDGTTEPAKIEILRSRARQWRLRLEGFLAPSYATLLEPNGFGLGGELLIWQPAWLFAHFGRADGNGLIEVGGKVDLQCLFSADGWCRRQPFLIHVGAWWDDLSETNVPAPVFGLETEFTRVGLDRLNLGLRASYVSKPDEKDMVLFGLFASMGLY